MAGPRVEATATKTTCHGLQSSQLRLGLLSVCSVLEAPVLLTYTCLSWGASRAPTPPSPVVLLRRGSRLPGGGSYVSRVCHVFPSCVLIWLVSCPRLVLLLVKGIVHFEIKIWYVSAYPKGIQDVGVFFSSVDPILMFLGQTVLVCQSYNGRYRSLSLWEGKITCTEKFKLNNSPS